MANIEMHDEHLVSQIKKEHTLVIMGKQVIQKKQKENEKNQSHEEKTDL